MATLAELLVKIGADTSALQRGLQEVQKATESAGNRLRSAFDRALPYSQALAGGLLAAGVAATTFAVNSAGKMEQLRTSFDVLLGSAERGRKIFSDLSNMANITPFDTEDLASAAQTLLGFGVQGEKVLPILQELGDISMGNKEHLQGLALAFAQVSSAGKMQGQDLLQMINAGFNPLQIISQKTGKSMAELRKEMEKGAISADMVRDAMVTATSAGGQFFQGMQRGSQTLPGLISTIQDNVGKVARSLVGLTAQGDIVKGSLFDRVKAGAQELGDKLTELSNLIDQKGLVGAFNKIFPPETHGRIALIAGALSGLLIPALISATAAAASLVISFGPFALLGAAIGGAAYLIYKNWDKIAPVLSRVENALRPVMNIFKAVGQAISEVFRSIDWKAIGADLLRTFNSLKPALAPVIPMLKFFGAIIGGVIVTAIGVAIGIINGFIKALGGVAQFLGGLVKIVSGVFGLIVGIFTGNTEQLKTAWHNLWTGIRDVFAGFGRAIWGLISGFVEGIIKFFVSLYDRIVGHSIIPDLVNSIINWIAKLPSRVVAYFINLKDSAIQALSSLASSAANYASHIYTNIKNKLEDAWNYIKSIPGKALGWGKDIINSIVNGIKSIHIPLPHFTFGLSQTSIAGIKIPVPTASIKWYEQGGIFSAPSIIGVGEAGKEAVIPIDRLTPLLADAIAKVKGQAPDNIVINNNFEIHATVHSDTDIKKLSEQIYNLQMVNLRARGVTA